MIFKIVLVILFATILCIAAAMIAISNMRSYFDTKKHYGENIVPEDQEKFNIITHRSGYTPGLEEKEN